MSSSQVMSLVKINFDDVLNDSRDGVSTRFNTCFHPMSHIPDLSRPSEAPTSFSRWLPLIMRTRHLKPEAAQIIRFTPAQVKLIAQASHCSATTGEITQAHEEDLRAEILTALSSLKFPPEGLFMRLDRVSPKDGTSTVPGKLPLHSEFEIILRLITSQRSHDVMMNRLESGESAIGVTFLPFNDRMESRREYRSYCAPGSGVITAVSQYCWHKPWLLAGTQPQNLMEVVGRIWQGIRDIHRQIMRELDLTEKLDCLLLKQGFSFDVFYDEGKDAFQLVELNVSGARSGCGSCLFHWINDFDLLYGDGKNVQFRVAF
ncbi:hypothetical protein FZEAL_2766 [Fusarium zealandicum]|uniref:Cell division cycle protein 123 n=1 Tax=Fusarium zealandicum TaxID=1053134 RepID=A0A8H4XN87_9HYPO|nr:hypothetical protein FZEAL_2766 [Fusarium zealandicum]